jgi:hypothetical protein
MKQVIFIISLLGALVLLDSCKKNDSSFESIKIPGVEDTLEGRWTVVSVNATGKNVEEPDGYYQLDRNPNEYTYDLKTKLEMKFAGLTFDYNYNDRDAGTWEVAEDQKSVLFKGNQGIDQRLYFTNYDSLDALYMRVAIPVDTTMQGFKYEGTVFVNMRKD